MKWLIRGSHAFNFNQTANLSFYKNFAGKFLLLASDRQGHQLAIKEFDQKSTTLITNLLTAFGGNDMIINPYDIADSFDNSVCAGKEKIRVPDLIQSYPDGVTINGLQKFSDDKDGYYYGYTFLENDLYFFTGGGFMLFNFTEKLIEKCGSLSDANLSLNNFPIKIKISKPKGKNYYVVSVIKNNSANKNFKSNRADEIDDPELPF